MSNVKNLDGKSLFDITLKEGNILKGGWRKYWSISDEDERYILVTNKEYQNDFFNNGKPIKYRFAIDFWQDWEGEDKDIYIYLYLIPSYESLHSTIINKISKIYDNMIITKDNLNPVDLLWNWQIPVLANDSIECSRTLKSWNSRKINEAIESATLVIETINMFIGFYLDKAENRIGTTGWDFLREICFGEDAIEATMKRWKRNIKKEEKKNV